MTIASVQSMRSIDLVFQRAQGHMTEDTAPTWLRLAWNTPHSQVISYSLLPSAAPDWSRAVDTELSQEKDVLAEIGKGNHIHNLLIRP